MKHNNLSILRFVYMSPHCGQVSSLESLMSRNKEMVVKTEGPAEGFTLPFILLEVLQKSLPLKFLSSSCLLLHY